MQKPFSLYLSKAAAEVVSTESASLGVSPEMLCMKIIEDWCDDPDRSGIGEGTDVQRNLSRTAPVRTVPAGEFDVARHYPRYPAATVELTQEFITEAAKLPDVRVEKRGRAVIFSPRFVHIDYPLSTRGSTAGLVCSFYGNVGEFDDPRRFLKPGRKSYARARITNRAELDYCRRFIAEAYHRRMRTTEA